MGKVTPIYSYYTLQQGDIVYPYFDETNMVTTDNQFGGLYGFVGTGTCYRVVFNFFTTNCCDKQRGE